MAVQHIIIRLRRTDRAKEHILVNVTCNGSRPLDLKLVATDQEHLFHQTIKESDIKPLQSTQFTGDLQDWKSTLSYVLLQTRPDGPLPKLLQGVEGVASIGKGSVSLTIRKNVDGITQKLGVIELEQDDEREEVAAFDWVDAAVASSDELRSQLETLQVSLASQQNQVAQLNKQLDELISTKREHEDELLSKFAALLNSKKLKIRDQQRLLSGAKVDPGVAKAVQKVRSGDGNVGRTPGVSRAGKRKAEPENETAHPGQNPAQMDHDTGEDTDTDADDDDEEGGRQETPPDSDGDVGQDDVDNEQPVGDMEVDSDKEPPPRRELPFTRKPSSREQVPPSTSDVLEADQEDDTDDEL